MRFWKVHLIFIFSGFNSYIIFPKYLNIYSESRMQLNNWIIEYQNIAKFTIKALCVHFNTNLSQWYLGRCFSQHVLLLRQLCLVNIVLASSLKKFRASQISKYKYLNWFPWMIEYNFSSRLILVIFLLELFKTG